MRFFITGFRGYVGSAVARVLAARGHAIVALARTDEEQSEARNRGYIATHAELTDLTLLRERAAEADGVFHGVANPNPAFAPVNAAAVEALLSALGTSQAFAMQGGTGVFGDTGDRVFDGTEALQPPLAMQAGLERSVLASTGRGYVVYAPLVYGGSGAMIPNAMLRAARLARAGQYPGDGTNRWSTVHIDDWAELIALLLEKGPSAGGAYVAASGEKSTAEVAREIANAIGVQRTVSLSPSLADEAWGFFASLLSINQRFTASRAHDAVQWRPKGQSLGEALRAG